MPEKLILYHEGTKEQRYEKEQIIISGFPYFVFGFNFYRQKEQIYK